MLQLCLYKILELSVKCCRMLSLFHNEGAEVNTYIQANGVNEAAVGA